MATPEFGPLYYSPMNRQLYYDDIRRHFGAQEGQIQRGQEISQYRFKPPRAGIQQDWSGEERRGAAMGEEGGTMKLFSGLVETGIGARQSRKEKQKKDQQAVENWQGAYQQASQQSQTSVLKNQMASLMMGTHPAQQIYKAFSTPSGASTPMSSPVAQISQNLYKMGQAARQTSLSSPMAQINQNLSRMNQQAQQTQQAQQQPFGMPPGESTPLTSPTALINRGAPQWAAPQAMSSPVQTPLPSSDPNAPRRSGQRTPGWK